MSRAISQIEPLESRRLLTFTLTNLELRSHGGQGIENGLSGSPELNNLGTVAGTGSPSLTIFDHATLRVVRSGVVKQIDVGAFGPTLNSYGRDLNEKNQVVGETTDSKGVPHAFISTLGKKDAVTLKKLGDVKGISGTIAYAVNKSGVVAGGAGLLTGKDVAVVWTPGAGGKYSLTQLPRVGTSLIPGQGPSSIATDINDAGVIAGSGIGSTLTQRAAIWKKGSKGYAVTDLGGLPGGFQNSAAYAINEKGQVVGMAGAKDFRPHPVLFSLNSKGKYGITDLGLPAGADSAEAIDINESGVIVGRATFSGEPHALLWTKNSKGKYTMTDLHKQLPAGSNWALEQPTSINDSNSIAGEGLFNGGVATWVMTFSGKGFAIKLATVPASLPSSTQAPRAPATAATKIFSTHDIAESVLL